MPWSVYNSNGKLLQSLAIADDSIVEGKLDVSNAPTNGYFLQAQSGEGGGLTWAAVTAPTEATQANMEAEATGSLFVPPDLVKNSPGVAKFWVYWEQSGTHSMLASYNMTSVTDGGSAGITNHVFATDFSSANWCGVSMPGSVNGGTIRQNGGGNRAAGTMSTTSEDSGGTDTDMSHCGMAGFGDQ